MFCIWITDSNLLGFAWVWRWTTERKVCSDGVSPCNGHIWHRLHWEIAFFVHFSGAAKDRYQRLSFSSFVRTEYTNRIWRRLLAAVSPYWTLRLWIAVCASGVRLVLECSAGAVLELCWALSSPSMHMQADGRQLYQNPGSPIDVKECSQSNALNISINIMTEHNITTIQSHCERWLHSEHNHRSEPLIHQWDWRSIGDH